jgi:5-deoxy-glucuronate isomerase
MNYKKTYKSTQGFTSLSKVGTSTLSKLEFGMVELAPGTSVNYDTGENETAFIFLGGNADFELAGKKWENVGGRRSVFEGKAHSVYIPRRQKIRITGRTNVKIAVAGTKVDVDTEPQLITPEKVRASVLGVKPWERESHFIIDGTTNAKKLTVGEGFATPGNWSGFPPHKHDVDNMPAEAVLDEIYYFLFQPSQGFGIQRLYTKDGEIDECYVVKNDDFVEFPRGYHTTVGAPGYNMYLLWMMAGEHQGFFRSNDPDHDWVAAVENMVKKYK